MSQAETTIFSGWTVRRVIVATLVVVAVVFGFWLLYHYRMVFFSLFIGIVIGTALKPVVNWLNQRGVPTMFGSVMAYLVLLALLVMFVTLLVPLIVDQVTMIVGQLPDYYQGLRELLLSSRSMLLWRLGLQLPPQLGGTTSPPQTPVSEGEEAEQTLATVIEIINYLDLVGWGIFITIATLLLGFYWTLEGPRAVRTLLFLVPQQQRTNAQEIFGQIEEKVGAYIRGQAILCLVIGVVSFIAYFLIGLPYALVLAVIAGILEAVPYLGPMLSAVLPLLLALSSDPSKIIWVVIAVIIIQQLENNLLVPRIMDESVGVNPIVTLLSIAAFGALLGVAGAILAIPIAAIIQLLLDRFVLGSEALDPEAPKGRDSLSVLRYETQSLIQDLRKQIRQKDKELVVDEPVDQVEENIEAIASSLDSVLAEASQEQEEEKEGV